LPHELQEVEATGGIGVMVEEGFLEAGADARSGGEVEDSVDGAFQVEEGGETGIIA
jgi:hypothetical protein